MFFFYWTGDTRYLPVLTPSFPTRRSSDLGRKRFGQHRHDAIGEIDAVAALPRLDVERRAGADVEADVGDRDDRFPAAVILRIVVGRRPHRVVMIARVGGVDRDARQVRQTPARRLRPPLSPHIGTGPWQERVGHA